jgi:3-methyladenine DNA glycosylase AlkC
MAEPFKHLLDATRVQHAALQLARHAPGFDASRFVALAVAGLEGLELKARAMHIADALQATLPKDFGAACAAVEAALAPPVAVDDTPPVPASAPDAGLSGWILWPVGEFVARRGMGEPARALQALHAITQRFTAEFAIRPFIQQHPALSFDTLARWVNDPSAHVRRLVSEGSRPRLPWGLQLRALVADPSPTLPLLRALQDDPSAYVRRSVANHLNDIAKDHPALVAAWLHEHLPGAGPQRRALLRHASRTLIKAGDAAVLGAWGLGTPFEGQARLALAPRQLLLGGALDITLALRSHAARPQALAVDLVMHHRKADGRTMPKVFKGWQLTLPPQGQRTLQRAHPMRPITTRRYHAGRHVLAVQINGQTVAEAAFTLCLPPGY